MICKINMNRIIELSFEIPLGATRFNSDSQKLEYWMGSAWMQIKTFSPNLNGGGHYGFICWWCRNANVYQNIIDYVTISTPTGILIDFSDLSYLQYAARSFSSSSRGLWYGGYPGGTSVNTISFVTISSKGDAEDFGDATSRNNSGAGLSNATRGLDATGFYELQELILLIWSLLHQRVRQKILVILSQDHASAVDADLQLVE